MKTKTRCLSSPSCLSGLTISKEPTNVTSLRSRDQGLRSIFSKITSGSGERWNLLKGLA